MENRPNKPSSSRRQGQAAASAASSGMLRQFRPAISDDWLSTDPRANSGIGPSRKTAASNLLKESSGRASSSTQVPHGGKPSASSRGLPSTSSRSAHPKTVGDVKRLACPECLLTMDGVPALEEHWRKRHDDSLVVLACPHCGEAIKHRTNLHRHIRIKHDDRTGRSHCRKCGFVCASVQELERHKQRHNTCPFCKLVMESGTGLSKHMRNCRRRSSAA